MYKFDATETIKQEIADVLADSIRTKIDNEILHDLINERKNDIKHERKCMKESLKKIRNVIEVEDPLRYMVGVQAMEAPTGEIFSLSTFYSGESHEHEIKSMKMALKAIKDVL